MLKPVGDKILLEFKKQEAPAGILLPDHIKSKVEDDAAVVVGVGTDSDIVVKLGDHVIFNPHAAMVVEMAGTQYILVTQKAILAITNFDREGR